MKTEPTSNLGYYPHTPLKGDKEWIVGVPNQPGTNLFKATATCFHEPDARLYAAAPELLEACKFALSAILTAEEYEEIQTGLFTNTLETLRTAIAKATI